MSPRGLTEDLARPIKEKPITEQNALSLNHSQSINQSSREEKYNLKEPDRVDGDVVENEEVKNGAEYNEKIDGLEGVKVEHSTDINDRKQIVIIVIVSSSGILFLILISFCYIRKVFFHELFSILLETSIIDKFVNLTVCNIGSIFKLRKVCLKLL